MQHTFLWLGLGLGCCAACGPIEPPGSQAPARAQGPPPELTHTGKAPRAKGAGHPDTLRITDDAFVAQVFDHFMLYEKVIAPRRKFRLSQQMEPSADDPKVVDTTNTFSDQFNSYTYFCSGDPASPGASLLRATVRSATVRWPKRVQVGMSQADFAAAFRVVAVPAVAVVTEAEGYQRFTFTFANARLVSINFVSNYLD